MSCPRNSQAKFVDGYEEELSRSGSSRPLYGGLAVRLKPCPPKNRLELWCVFSRRNTGKLRKKPEECPQPLKGLPLDATYGIAKAMPSYKSVK